MIRFYTEKLPHLYDQINGDSEDFVEAARNVEVVQLERTQTHAIALNSFL
jgi:hypothetical protein